MAGLEAADGLFCRPTHGADGILVEEFPVAAVVESCDELFPFTVRTACSQRASPRAGVGFDFDRFALRIIPHPPNTRAT
jgi:hypothetical protein